MEEVVIQQHGQNFTSRTLNDPQILEVVQHQDGDLFLDEAICRVVPLQQDVGIHRAWCERRVVPRWHPDSRVTEEVLNTCDRIAVRSRARLATRSSSLISWSRMSWRNRLRSVFAKTSQTPSYPRPEWARRWRMGPVKRLASTRTMKSASSSGARRDRRS